MKFILFALLTGLVAAAPKKANIARQLEGLADGGYSIDAAGNITPLPASGHILRTKPSTTQSMPESTPAPLISINVNSSPMGNALVTL
jgi:hypothetical protein